MSERIYQLDINDQWGPIFTIKFDKKAIEQAPKNKWCNIDQIKKGIETFTCFDAQLTAEVKNTDDNQVPIRVHLIYEARIVSDQMPNG